MPTWTARRCCDRTCTRSNVRIAIIGRGLIGGSVELRARSIGWKVRWHDPADPQSRSLDEVVAKAQTIVVAAPLGATLEIVRRLAECDARLIVDVASVKVPVVAAGSGVRGFVATHPMAGKERGGVENAEATLFEGRPWAYVSSGDETLDTRARDFIAAMGANAFAVDAEAHDRALARTSHLPQLLGFVLADRIAELDEGLRESASGPVARELLSIAKSDRTLWDEIFAANGGNVAEEARAVAARLEALAAELVSGGGPSTPLRYARDDKKGDARDDK
jgi:prephenate dehydrogenase